MQLHMLTCRLPAMTSTQACTNLFLVPGGAGAAASCGAAAPVLVRGVLFAFAEVSAAVGCCCRCLAAFWSYRVARISLLA